MRRMMKCIVTACIALFTVIHIAHAEERTLAGVYNGDPQAGKRVAEIIDKAATQFNFIIRPIARSRLKTANPVHPHVVIAQDSKDVTITFGNNKPMHTALNWGPGKWTREDGEVFDLTSSWKDGVLTQTFVAADGERINRYSLSPDNAELTLEVVLTSPRLDKPITYVLKYRREIK